MLVHANIDRLAAVGSRDVNQMVLAVRQIVGRIELEVVKAVVESDADSSVIVHLKCEVVGQTLLVHFV